MSTVLGNARLTRDALVVDTNSRERMDRALAMLRPALAAGTEVAPYDVSWMWRELGVEDER